MRALISLFAALALLAACQAPASPPAATVMPVDMITPGPPAPMTNGNGSMPILAPPTPAPAATPVAPSPTPLPGTLKLAAIGASDVVGLGATNPGTEGWAPVLATLLTERTGKPIALSKHGFLARLASELRKNEVPKAIAGKPDLVVIWTGANDMRVGLRIEDFRAALDGILTDLQATRVPVWVLNLPALDRLPFFAEFKAAYKAAMPAWQATIRESAAAHGATTIALDQFSDEIDKNPDYLWAFDGFHPSTKGYARLAAIVADTVAPAVVAAQR